MMTPINMLAIDLAKGSFQVCAIGRDGAVLYSRVLLRMRLTALLTEHILHRCEGSLRHVTLLGSGGAAPWS